MKPVKAFLHAPETTDEQRVRFAILCAMEVCQGPKHAEWRQWAEKWLSGEDRSEESAQKTSLGMFYDPGHYATFAATSPNNIYWPYYTAEHVRREWDKKIQQEAIKWAGEEWPEVYKTWRRSRRFPFKKLIKQSQQEGA